MEVLLVLDVETVDVVMRQQRGRLLISGRIGYQKNGHVEAGDLH